MNDKIREFLQDLIDGMPASDPYDGLEPEDFYCGNEDDARNMAEGHVEYTVGKRAKDLLESLTVTDEQLTALREEAGAAGDTGMMILSGKALDGDECARLACAEAINSARAMED